MRIWVDLSWGWGEKRNHGNGFIHGDDKHGLVRADREFDQGCVGGVGDDSDFGGGVVLE